MLLAEGRALLDIDCVSTELSERFFSAQILCNSDFLLVMFSFCYFSNEFYTGIVNLFYTLLCIGLIVCINY